MKGGTTKCQKAGEFRKSTDLYQKLWVVPFFFFPLISEKQANKQNTTKQQQQQTNQLTEGLQTQTIKNEQNTYAKTQNALSNGSEGLQVLTLTYRHKHPQMKHVFFNC